MQEDKLDTRRQSKVGTIEVVRCEATYLREEYRPVNDINFNQANKKDAFKVTEGKYTMSTTKKGRYLHRAAPYDVQLKKLWRVGPECGRLTVHYRMGHTLEDMGIDIKPTDWSKVVVRRSPSPNSRSSSSSSPPQSPAESMARLKGGESAGPSSYPTSPDSISGSPAQSPKPISPCSPPMPSLMYIKQEPKEIITESHTVIVD